MSSFKHGVVKGYKTAMHNRNYNVAILSRITGMNLILLMSVLDVPFYRIKLTQHIRICKALSLSINDIPNDIHVMNL